MSYQVVLKQDRELLHLSSDAGARHLHLQPGDLQPRQLQRATSSVGPTRRAGDDTIRTTVKNTVEPPVETTPEVAFDQPLGRTLADHI